MPEFDFIIVGQGIAGSFLGYELLKRNQKILIIDEKAGFNSSLIAAGLFSPISGQRMALAWNAGAIFKYLDRFYLELERILESRFYYPIGSYKPFNQARDFNDWMGRSVDPAYSPFIKEIHGKSVYGHALDDGFGGVELNHSGFVNTVTLLSGFQRFFEKKNALVDAKFTHSLLNLCGDAVDYCGYHCRKIIFCEGSKAVKNPYFSWLPFNLVKGETLTATAPLELKQIISKDIFLLPLGAGVFKVGATYNRDDLTWNTTPEARSELLDKLSIFKCDFEIVDQHAGVRPATKDRRPFVGMHPEKPLGLFNGLGAKGVSLGPFYAGQMAGHLVFNEEIDKAASVSRYIK